ncbi:MAG TPA: hypothetical protein ENF78_02875 [Candidatus Bathyarchaeota archaeon]|nr:hypothetical protein [Candidatus Bathyarchaeota archaeon]
MLGVILAAGRGRRLAEITDHIPKALVEIASGISLLDLALNSLRLAGIRDVVVVVGYKDYMIEEALNGAEGVMLVKNPEYWRENGLSLLAAREFVDSEEFVLLMSDHIVGPELIRRAIRAGPLGLCVDRQPKFMLDPGEATKVKIGPGGHIVDIGKNLTSWDAFDTGVFACNELMFWAAAEVAKRSFSITISDCVRFLISRGIAFKAIDATGLPWADVDTPRCLRHAREVVLPEILRELGGLEGAGACALLAHAP